MTASIVATRRTLERLLALVITSVAAAVIRSKAGRGMLVEVVTRPCNMRSFTKPECRRQRVMALDALTNSTAVEIAVRHSRAALCTPVTVVAHQGPDVSDRLQLRFSTCAS